VWRVDQCTCAGGTPESSYAHEPSCGYEPIKHIDIGQAINEQVGDLPELLRARLAEMAEGSDEPYSLEQVINEGLMPLVAAHVDWERRVSRRAHDELAAARQQLDHARADGQTAQRDLAAILRALDLGDHARMISSHYVVVEEVLPAIEHMRQQLDQVRALAEQTRLYPDTLRAILDAPARPAGHDETGQ
jgi:hypothetical protein